MPDNKNEIAIDTHTDTRQKIIIIDLAERRERNNDGNDLKEIYVYICFVSYRIARIDFVC